MSINADSTKRQLPAPLNANEKLMAPKINHTSAFRKNVAWVVLSKVDTCLLINILPFMTIVAKSPRQLKSVVQQRYV